MAVAEPKNVDKKAFKASLKNTEDKKAAKKAYKADVEFNDEITISKFVCDELDKFSSPLVQRQVRDCEAIVAVGIKGIISAESSELKAELKAARALSKNDAGEKEYRTFAIDMAKNKIAALVGMCGSGKSVVCDMFVKRGLEKLFNFVFLLAFTRCQRFESTNYIRQCRAGARLCRKIFNINQQMNMIGHNYVIFNFHVIKPFFQSKNLFFRNLTVFQKPNFGRTKALPYKYF